MSAVFLACHSILELDARHPFTARALLDAQAMHRLVMSGFHGWVEDGADDARAQLQVLHTANADLKQGTLTVVVQSRVQPDWTRIPSAALKGAPGVILVEEKIETGRRYRFRAVVNPARMSDRHLRPSEIPPEGRSHMKRLADTTPDHARRWFAERLQPPGEPPVGDRGVRRIGAFGDPATLVTRVLPKIAGASGKPKLRIGRAEIRGELTVTSPDVFADVLTTGLGHARAYGCGLILIKPVPIRPNG
ncbi:type I-E CRISPR-associated protein Cas6/Cse3/CasE [Streptosporangium sp. NPDC051022]|uniref:type I-E CRISPR-associated protein Cas6/Cse3/CasE n=1 Tax=Streptosporangium sp. NPDC051022 TaxID=3155752 RepID=UPI0034398A14